MDLRAFYQKIREIEQTIQEEFTVVVSESTPDGGRAGVVTEVARAVAGRLVAEQRARLATPEEAAAHREQLTEAGRRAAHEQAASRMQVTVISEADLRNLRDNFRPQKG